MLLGYKHIYLIKNLEFMLLTEESKTRESVALMKINTQFFIKSYEKQQKRGK